MSAILNKNYLTFVIVAIIGLIIWFIPPPTGLSLQAMHIFAIFIFTVLGIILRPFPMGTIAFLGLMLTVATNTLSFEQTFSGFMHQIVWLIIIAFFISRGFIKTGLGSRIAYCMAYYIMRLFGKHVLVMVYGMVLTDLILAPAIPSITARVGGIIYPIVNSLSRAFGSEPFSHPRRLGAFLMITSFQSSVIIGGMFLTSMAGNPLIAEIAKGIGINLTWGTWALAASIPGLIALIVVPIFIYIVYPPELKRMPNAISYAKEKLKEMGPVSIHEWIMVVCFLLLIFLWILGPLISMAAVTAGLIGLSILLLTSVLSWEDIIKEKGAWNMLFWFATLIMMASYLNTLGLTSWFSSIIENHVAHFHWLTGFIILSLVYFYSHYFFASVVAHIGSMYSAFLLLSVALGTPPMIAALTLAFFSNLFGGLTQYACGPAPIFFGAGYVRIMDWWKIGLYGSFINIAIYFGIGTLWWSFLGYF